MSSREDFGVGLEDVFAICAQADSQIASKEADQIRLANAQCRAGLVLLCGYFEGFVRSLVADAIEDINERKVDISRVPDRFFCGVIGGVAEAMERNISNDVDGFKRAVRTGGGFALNSKAFSKMGGNPSVDRVETVFRIFGVENVLDVLSKRDYGVDSTFLPDSQVEPIRKSLSVVLASAGAAAAIDDVIAVIEKKWSPRTKRRKVGYIACIEQLLDKRNRIAHGEGIAQVTPKELRGWAAELQRLADGLMEQVAVVMASLRPDARACASDAERWNYLKG